MVVVLVPTRLHVGTGSGLPPAVVPVIKPPWQDNGLHDGLWGVQAAGEAAGLLGTAHDALVADLEAQREALGAYAAQQADDASAALATLRRATRAIVLAVGRTINVADAAKRDSSGALSAQEGALAAFQDAFAAGMVQEQVHAEPFDVCQSWCF